MKQAPQADMQSHEWQSRNGLGRPTPGMTSRRWWPWAKRLVTLVFFAGVAYLIITQARSVDWDKVFTAIRQRPAGELAITVCLAAASFALFSCFDLLGRYMTGHRLSIRQVMTVNFISYAFNLNMGALVGGVGFRYRLYSRLGLDAETMTRVVVMSMLTNWIGYLMLAGITFSLAPLAPPSDWRIGSTGLRMLGVLLLAVAITYVLLCAFARRRSWVVKGYEVTLPSLRLALLQLSMSIANWLLIAATIFTLLEQKLAFSVVLGVMLVAAIAGVVTHVPAGLGVLEAVFIALLSHQIGRTDLLAALLTYRAIYYLAPLAVATLVYLTVEARTRHKRPAE